MSNDSFKIEDIKIDVLINYNFDIPNDYFNVLLGYDKEKKKTTFSNEEHDVLKWKFTFFKGELSSKKVNESIENNESKVAVVCFVDDILSDKVRRFLNSLNKYSRIVLVTKGKKIDCSKLKFSPKKDSQLEIDDVSAIEYNDKSPTNLLIELLNASRYFNQLEDDFVFPSLDSSLELTEENKKKNIPANLNIFVAGQPGGGKSTFINTVLGKKKAYCLQSGSSVTSKIIRYVHEEYPISIFDSPGFEGKRTDAVKAAFNKFCENLEEAKDKIHLIVFVVSLGLDRCLKDEDKNFLELVLKKGIKLQILFTKYDKNDEKIHKKQKIFIESFKEFFEKKKIEIEKKKIEIEIVIEIGKEKNKIETEIEIEIEKEKKKIKKIEKEKEKEIKKKIEEKFKKEIEKKIEEKFKKEIKKKIEEKFKENFHVVNMIREENNPIFGLDKLFKTLYKNFKPEKIAIEDMDENNYIQIVRKSAFFQCIDSLEDLLERNKKEVKKIIGSAVALATLVGLSPIPFSDSFLLIPIQGGMVISISRVYGRYKTLKDLGANTASAAASTGIGAIGRALGFIGGLLKFIPVIGSVLGAIMCSSVAGTSTFVMGLTALSILDKEVKSCGGLELFKAYAENYNKAIKSLNELRNRFSRGEITNRACA